MRKKKPRKREIPESAVADKEKQEEVKGKETTAEQKEKPQKELEQIEDEQQKEKDAAEKEQKAAEAAKKKRKTKRAFRRLITKLVIVAGIVFSLLHWVFSFYVVRGNNMYPALRDGELVITYKLGRYNVGDVVVYTNPAGGKSIARIVAREGDTYDILEEYGPQINGSMVTEDIFYPTEAGTYKLPIFVKPGEVLLLNDMRSNKEDGRSFGTVKLEDTFGKVVFSFQVRGF